MSNTTQAPSRSQAANATQRSSAATIINVMTMVDTDLIKQTYGPNNSKDNPQGLNHHEGITMACPASNYVGEVDNDPANIIFKANVEDTVCFNAYSLSGNCEDAVIFYDIEHTDDTVNVFNPFSAKKITRTGAAVPDTNQRDGLPAMNVTRDFYTFESVVANKGVEGLKIRFAIYELDDTRENQVLYGYYWWDPTIEVQ
jgi:hypothetical protein